MSFSELTLFKLNSDIIRPRWSVRLDFLSDFSDPVWMTSHPDSAVPTGAVVLASTLINSPVKSQRLQLISSIGRMTLQFNNVNDIVLDKFREKLNEGKGTNLKRIQVHQGFEGEPWSTYEVSDSGVVGDLAYLDGVVSVDAEGINQIAKGGKVFEEAETVLLSNVIEDKQDEDISFSAGDDSINAVVTDLSGFKINAKIRIGGSTANTGFTTVVAITTSQIITSGTIDYFDGSAYQTKSMISEAAGSLITISQATIECLNETSFEMFKHGTSFTDSPNQKVGYVTIGKTHIRYESTGAGIFQNCTQGVLNTVQKKQSVKTNVDDANNVKIKSHVYIEMPALEFLYGILLGPHYSQAGENFPDLWTLKLDGAYIRATDFINIGDDLWDVLDSLKGEPCYFNGIKPTSAKRFIETQLLPLVGCEMPIYNDGEWGLKRNTPTMNGSSPTIVLDDSNVISYGALRHENTRTRNTIEVLWHKDSITGEYRRRSVFPIVSSIGLHTKTETFSIKLDGLHNSISAESSIAAVAERIADRIAFPPLSINVEINPRIASKIYNGLVVLFCPSKVKDYTGSGTSINRPMKVIQKKSDLRNNDFSISLEGVSGRIDAILGTLKNTILTDTDYMTFYGTRIDISSLASFYTSGGGGHISGEDLIGGTLVGSKFFYYGGNLTIDDGNGKLTNNVVMMVRGFWQCNDSNLDGVGGGSPGNSGYETVVAADNVTTGVYLGNNSLTPGIGSSISNGGYHYLQIWVKDNIDGKELKFSYNSLPGAHSKPNEYSSELSQINIVYKSGNGITGIESKTLVGIGGSSGTPISLAASNWTRPFAEGGKGGDGGASLIVVARGGAFGANAKVNLSGTPGIIGEKTAHAFWGRFVGGTGAPGHPGAFLFINDGVGASPPVTTGKVIQKMGSIPVIGQRLEYDGKKRDYPVPEIPITDDDYYRGYHDYSTTIGRRDVSEAYSLIKYVRELGGKNEEPIETLPEKITNLAASEDNSTISKNIDGTLNISVKLSWTIPDDPLIDRMLVRYREFAYSKPFFYVDKALNRTDSEAFIGNLKVGQKYSFGLQSVNTHGEESGWVSVTYTVIGNVIPPAPPTNVRLRSDPIGVRIDWLNPSDKDLATIRLFSSSANSIPDNPLFDIAATRFDTDQYYSVPMFQGSSKYFWLKSVDSSGNESTIATPVPVVYKRPVEFLADRTKTFHQNTKPLGTSGDIWHDLSDGTSYQNSAGAALYEYDSRITETAPASDELIGGGVALSGDGKVLAVGALGVGVTGSDQGAVFIFDVVDGAVTQRGGHILASNAAAFDSFGIGLALSYDGSRLVVGAPGQGTGGSFYIVEYNGVLWTEIFTAVTFTGQLAGDSFGHECGMSADGTVVAIGAHKMNSSEGGVVLFDYDGKALNQRATIVKASDGAGNAYEFGRSCGLSADGSLLVVGAPKRGGGALYVHTWDGTNWTETVTGMGGSDTGSYDGFGFGISITNEGTRIIVGAFDWDGTTHTNQGAVYIIDLIGTTWTETFTAITASDAGAGYRFGYCTGANSDGSIIVVGSPQWGTGPDINTGNVYMLNTGWIFSADQTGSHILETFSDDLIIDSDMERNDIKYWSGASTLPSKDSSTAQYGANSLFISSLNDVKQSDASGNLIYLPVEDTDTLRVRWWAKVITGRVSIIVFSYDENKALLLAKTISIISTSWTMRDTTGFALPAGTRYISFGFKMYTAGSANVDAIYIKRE